MAVGSFLFLKEQLKGSIIIAFFLFLQEQIKGIIIIHNSSSSFTSLLSLDLSISGIKKKNDQGGGWELFKCSGRARSCRSALRAAAAVGWS